MDYCFRSNRYLSKCIIVYVNLISSDAFDHLTKAEWDLTHILVYDCRLKTSINIHFYSKSVLHCVALIVERKTWVGWDDLDMIINKVKYAMSKKLGGIMLWELALDDFTGSYCSLGPR